MMIVEVPALERLPGLDFMVSNPEAKLSEIMEHIKKCCDNCQGFCSSAKVCVKLYDKRLNMWYSRVSKGKANEEDLEK